MSKFQKRFAVFGWYVVVNSLRGWSKASHGYHRYRSAGCGPDVRSIVLRGVEISWWRRAHDLHPLQQHRIGTELMSEGRLGDLQPVISKNDCGNHRDRFPCLTCGARVPIQCPRYAKDHAQTQSPNPHIEDPTHGQ